MKKLKFLLSAVLLALIIVPASLCAAQITDEDMALGGIRLGMTARAVEDLYGAPDVIEDGAQGFVSGELVILRTCTYKSLSLQVRFLPDEGGVYDVMVGRNEANPYIEEVTDAAREIATPQGIRPGSTREDLEAAYGSIPKPKCDNKAPPTCGYFYENAAAKLGFYICPEVSPGIRSIRLTVK